MTDFPHRRDWFVQQWVTDKLTFATKLQDLPTVCYSDRYEFTNESGEHIWEHSIMRTIDLITVTAMWKNARDLMQVASEGNAAKTNFVQQWIDNEDEMVSKYYNSALNDTELTVVQAALVTWNTFLTLEQRESFEPKMKAMKSKGYDLEEHNWFVQEWICDPSAWYNKYLTFEDYPRLERMALILHEKYPKWSYKRAEAEIVWNNWIIVYNDLYEIMKYHYDKSDKKTDVYPDVDIDADDIQSPSPSPSPSPKRRSRSPELSIDRLIARLVIDDKYKQKLINELGLITTENVHNYMIAGPPGPAGSAGLPRSKVINNYYNSPAPGMNISNACVGYQTGNSVCTNITAPEPQKICSTETINFIRKIRDEFNPKAIKISLTKGEFVTINF